MPRTPNTPLPAAAVNFTLATRGHGVHVTTGQEHLFSAPDWARRADGRVVPTRYDVTRIGHVTAPFERTLRFAQRSAISAPHGRTLLTVDAPLLGARVLASRADDGELAHVLASRDPWAVMTTIAGERLATIAPVDQHRRVTKAAFFELLFGATARSMVPTGITPDSLSTVTKVLADRFTNAAGWLDHDVRRQAKARSRWSVIETAVAQLHAEILEIAHERILDANGNALPVLVDVTCPIIEVDDTAAEQLAAGLCRDVRHLLAAATHVPCAPTADPTVWADTSATLTGITGMAG